MTNILSALVLLSFVGVFVYFFWSAFLFVFPRYRNDCFKIYEPYTMYIMIPMMNECYVARSTVESFYKHYQQKTNDNITINLLVIDDGSDDGTTEILAELEEKYETLHVLNRVLPEAQTGKGEALNAGLTYIRLLNETPLTHTLIGIMDADAFISMDDFEKVFNTFFSYKDISMVQITVGMNSTKKWLHIMQDIEFQSCNYMIQNTRNYFGNSAASGNGQFFRLSDLPLTEVWGNSLLEDFESSTKLLLRGKKTYYLEDAKVIQEPVSSIKTLVKQRTRWAQGGIECIGKYSGIIFKSKTIPLRAKLEMYFYMFLPFVTAVSVIGHGVVMMLQFYGVVKKGLELNGVLLVIIILSLLISLTISTVYWRRTGLSFLRCSLYGLTIPVYNLTLIPVAYSAIYRYITNNSTWEKTVHLNTSQELEEA